MNAVVALRGGVVLGVNVECVVGTRLHTCLATDALVVIEINDTVIAFEECLGRTDIHAGCVFAVVAAQHAEVPACVRECPALDILDPGAEDTKRDFIFRFTGRCAGVTADALPLIDYEPVAHVSIPSPRAAVRLRERTILYRISEWWPGYDVRK